MKEVQTAFAGLHTGNSAQIAQAIDAHISDRLLHLQSAIDVMADSMTSLREELAHVKAEIAKLRGGA